MSLNTWSGRNELLNEFHSAIQRGTHGRLSHLSLGVVDGALVIEARSAAYYAVQLALAAVQAFTADFPKLTPEKMSFLVNGHPLVLDNLSAGASGQAGGNDGRFGNGDSLLPAPHHTKHPPSSLV